MDSASEKLTADDIKDVFNEFSRKAVADFPELRDNFIVYCAPTDSFHGSYDAAKDPDLQNGLREVADAFRMKNNGVPAYAGKLLAFASGKTIDYMTYLAGDIDKNPRADLMNKIHHELGHIVAPGGGQSPLHENHFCECVAEAFAHAYSLPGNKQPDHAMIERHNWRDTAKLLECREFYHFAADVLEPLEGLSKRHDLSTLTPVQAANLAYRLSLEYGHKEADLARVAGIFLSGQRHKGKAKYETTENFLAFLEDIATTMLADHGGDSGLVFQVGKIFLAPFLANRPDVTGPWSGWVTHAAKSSGFAGDTWDRLREEIKRRDAAEEAARQTPAHIARDLRVLGFFDRTPDALIDPAKYETAENRQYLQTAMKRYVAGKTSAVGGPAA